MRLSDHVHHFALVISIYDLVIFIDVNEWSGLLTGDLEELEADVRPV